MKLSTCLVLLLSVSSVAAYRNGATKDKDRRRRTRGNRSLGAGAPVEPPTPGMMGGVKDGSMKGGGMKGGSMKDGGMKGGGKKGGMMGGGMKGGGKKGGMNKGGCESFRIAAPFDEILAGSEENAIGETLLFNVYDYDTRELIGTYNDAVTFQGEADCIFTGSFNFDLEEDDDFPVWLSQVSVTGTCLGETNSIVGGTGRFAGASGFETFIDADEEDVFASELTICGTTCADTCS